VPDLNSADAAQSEAIRLRSTVYQAGDSWPTRCPSTERTSRALSAHGWTLEVKSC